MNHPIFPCLWFNQNAEEAANYYESVFPEFKWIAKNPFAYNFELLGHRMMALNAGPEYSINSSISFFVNLEEEAIIQEIWDNMLAQGGKALMELNEYPWSPYYGWCQDKFGVNWQFMKGHEVAAKIVPNLSFTQENAGKAKEAMEFYCSIFPNSKPLFADTYQKGEHDVEGYYKYSQTLINGQPFCAMDSSMPGHEFVFNEGVSFVVVVDTQEEIDFYWEKLTAGGKEGRCGWLTDQFGVSWQVTPSQLGALMNNPETAPKTAYNFMQMNKIIIQDL